MSDERDDQHRRDTAPQPPASGSPENSTPGPAGTESSTPGPGHTRPYEWPPSGQQQADPYGQNQPGQGRPGQGRPGQGQPGQPGQPGQGQYAQYPPAQYDQYRQGPYAQYPQGQYEQPGQGQPGQYGYGQYDPGQYGQYGQGQYGQGQYGYPAGYGPYGQSVVPAKPAPVVVAAVLGMVFGALGVLVSLAVVLGGAALFGLAGALQDGSLGEDPFGTGVDPFAGLGADASNAFGVGLLVVGLLVVGWTVLTLWGSVWALTGRSRVLLLVGGSIAVPVTLLGLLGVATDPTTGGGAAFFSLVFFLAAVAIVVLLSLRTSARFFGAHRARRALTATTGFPSPSR
ncbi:hypothetical protein OF117_05605 [Geodermatophilus sp. YIM 151500]|uniref:hypothetical protein n=1 Tax=Geodermatophilus sp. YIM 151500 TaxID=2984531 RepID=UPI0021E4B581|nr:hypothetical protein [Geodermatophilus sp. YIM 151500]MCV2488832.1 hypothetical protein [Geodermatophilus sp. YIM 151500]